MELAAGVLYYSTGPNAGSVVKGSPTVIRYADDYVALCHSRQEALEVKARLATWLTPRGLAFNEDKTRVVHLNEGFDFLGFNVRRYRGKPLIKPSKVAIRRIRERLRTELRSLRGTNAQAVIKKLNPIIRGWADGGHGMLPIGGRRNAPLVAAVSPHWWPRFLPTFLS
jgi:RNA-directed DNA polymerase